MRRSNYAWLAFVDNDKVAPSVTHSRSHSLARSRYLGGVFNRSALSQANHSDMRALMISGIFDRK